MERKQEVYLDRNGKPILNGKDPRLNNALFEKYILPNYDMVYSLTCKYTDRKENVDESFGIVLTEFYKYIQSYNPERPLHTWIHICVRRCCQELNKRRFDYDTKYSDNNPMSSKTAREFIINNNAFHEKDMSDCLPDELVAALRMIQPHKLSAFILQVQGYTIKEITEIEFMRGHLKRKNEENVKSRIFQARKELKEILNRDGTLRSEFLKAMFKKRENESNNLSNEDGSEQG